MKKILIAATFIFFAVLTLTTFVPSSTARHEAAKYFTQDEINRGLEFAFQRRLLYWLGFGLDLAILAWIVFSACARKLADGCLALCGGRWYPAVLLVGGFCFLGQEAVALPLGIARLELVRAWGMTQRPIPNWLMDHLLGLAVSLVIGGIALTGLYLLIHWLPRWWWVPATLGTVLLAVMVAFLLPVWIAPLFNTFTPLAKTQWGDLEEPIERLAQKAGVPVKGVLVADASRQGSYTNAYFTGFGSTQRIVLYDTLLRAHTRLGPALATRLIGLAAESAGPCLGVSLLSSQQTMGRWEIESILAHEMGHWQHNHIVTGIALAVPAVLLAFFLLSRILRAAVGRPPFGLHTPCDPAGIPLVLLLSTIGFWLASPAENAVSRLFERQADMASLDLTQRPDVFIAAEKRLARDNIGNVAPSPISVWFFNTHPPPVERIRMAEQWHARRTGGTP